MILADEEATSRAGAQLAEVVRTGDVITLSGPLGVGKTALALSLEFAQDGDRILTAKVPPSWRLNCCPSCRHRALRSN